MKKIIACWLLLGVGSLGASASGRSSGELQIDHSSAIFSSDKATESAFSTSSQTAQSDSITWNDIQWTTVEKALNAGALSPKKTFIYVHAVWCPYCKRMNNEVLADPEVQDLLERYFHPVRIDAESQETIRYFDNEMTEQQFARALQNESFPTFYFMNQDGEVFGNQPGLMPKDVFMKLIHFVGTDAYLRGSFQDYEYPDSPTP